MTIDLSLPCSEQSLRSGEPLLGTATAGVEIWLLLENRERWEYDIAQTPLPAPVSELLGRFTARREVRMQLIRSDDRSGPLNFYIVLSSPFRAVHHFLLDAYEDLLSLDIQGLLTGEVTTHPDTRPLYLVCTHGRHDRCCARHGVAFHKKLVGAAPHADVWQCSHLGGHRFAATSVFLPAGLHYGRLQPDEALDMVEAHDRGEIYRLGRYRGQTRYLPPVQAAEGWLREQESVLSLEGPQLTAVEPPMGEQHAARFRTPDGKYHRLTVAPRHGQLARMTSCGAEQAEIPRWYDVVRHEAQTAEAAQLDSRA